MSDTSAGPGWWLASDGKWYAPELWTGTPPPEGAAPAVGAESGAGAEAQSPSSVPTPSVPPLPRYAAYPSPSPYPGPGPGPGPSPYAGGPSPYAGMGVPGAHYAQRQNNGLAVASLVCACAGVIPIFVGIPCILGIIFGFVARSQIRRSNGTQQGSGLALAGIIVGFSLIALFIVLISLAVAFGHATTCASTGDSCVVN